MPEQAIAQPWQTTSDSASTAEKSAMSPAPAQEPKLRSCIVCRNRKVRCDKLSPCSNCRRGNIACVYPSGDRPPRWARRLDRLTDARTPSAQSDSRATVQGADLVMDRLRNLENLVKELRTQLEQAHETAASSTATASRVASSGSSPMSHGGLREDEIMHPYGTAATDVHRHFGRLVLQDASRSHYLGSGFWSRIADEIEGLKVDACALDGDSLDSSDEEEPAPSPSTANLRQSPPEKHPFLLQHDLNFQVHNLDGLRPLPSQIPFLVDVFSENINIFTRIVHAPSIDEIVRGLRGTGAANLSPSNEALMFSIYYAAVSSMEEDDVKTNFGSSKSELSLKYRLGFEYTVTKAGFLTAPSLILVQAFTLFLTLARRHNSPRYVWMTTALVIRAAQYLGMQRDGSYLGNLSPFEIEIRRRVWWNICMLDMRAAEDEGTDLAIPIGSFDTKFPLNVNDADLDPEYTQVPTERYGLTDMSLPRILVGMVEIHLKLLSNRANNGPEDVESRSELLNGIYQHFEREYFQYTTEAGNIIYWVGTTVARLVMAKLFLICFLPSLLADSDKKFSDEIKTKLLRSAIEVAEYNHELNAEPACRQWRWVYQTHTHWHAIVYLMIEASRKPWSPIIERAWTALHSSWLIPTPTARAEKLRIWIPLRKLMAKVREHRDAELDRLRRDPRAVNELEMEDGQSQPPASSGAFPAGSDSAKLFREQWRRLVTVSGAPPGTQFAEMGDQSFIPSSQATHGDAESVGSIAGHGIWGTGSDSQTNLMGGPQGMTSAGTVLPWQFPFLAPPPPMSSGGVTGNDPASWTHPGLTNMDDDMLFGPDTDYLNANVDLDGDIDWLSLVESAKGHTV
ncbi:uncharacterized protein HMPREF1541_06916 [Cyphellophora europaea CBS 101466]|uniref:Zn(2)-C6 fungal-type domain-containing protein n=1 Tax=Cyphellophora europaea (strain CBS 101466) TaxID=1220924 RepID=W2RRF2_CYPE1|nr:uncharacterized protein HMPREF1541_06916 [Cyphellophora europaea CBS 101466]ETN38875.1 hypothetical protein HMPREF1541_06916 [Cyphellophora europaea CBS 101466]